jgi:hypothetical protein
MRPEPYDDGMPARMLDIVWLRPDEHTVYVMPEINPAELLHPLPPAPDPDRVWTLGGLLRSPPPAPPLPRVEWPVRLWLERAVGGAFGMVAHGGNLYLSEWIRGHPPTQADIDHALHLGWMGSIAPLLLSWEQRQGT